jgi:hypothetical protein
MKRMGIIGLALAGAIVTSAAVMAAVVFNPATGEGFVGKGDVQSAFGWNNARLQSNAGGVTFTFGAEVEQSVVCQHETGSQTLTRHGTRSGSVDSQVQHHARTHQQIDGFLLTGYGDVSEDFGDWENETGPGNDDIIPACFNQSQAWDVTDWVETYLSGPSLYVNFGGTSVQLY